VLGSGGCHSLRLQDIQSGTTAFGGGGGMPTYPKEEKRDQRNGGAPDVGVSVCLPPARLPMRRSRTDRQPEERGEESITEHHRAGHRAGHRAAEPMPIGAASFLAGAMTTYAGTRELSFPSGEKKPSSTVRGAPASGPTPVARASPGRRPRLASVARDGYYYYFLFSSVFCFPANFLPWPRGGGGGVR